MRWLLRRRDPVGPPRLRRPRDEVLVSKVTRWLSCAEGDDAPDGIVGRDANRHAVTGDDLDSEAAHPSAQLGEYFMTRIALDSIQPPRMHCYHGSLHVYEIVFAQQLILSLEQATSVPHREARRNAQKTNYF